MTFGPCKGIFKAQVQPLFPLDTLHIVTVDMREPMCGVVADDDAPISFKPDLELQREFSDFAVIRPMVMANSRVDQTGNIHRFSAMA